MVVTPTTAIYIQYGYNCYLRHAPSTMYSKQLTKGTRSNVECDQSGVVIDGFCFHEDPAFLISEEKFLIMNVDDTQV